MLGTFGRDWKSYIRLRCSANFSCLFRCRKSAISTVRKSQIRKFLLLIRKSHNCTFLQNTAQLCLKIVRKVVVLHDFFNFLQILSGVLYAIFGKRNAIYLQTCGSFKSANRKKDWVRKSQSKGSHLRKESKSNKYLSPKICGFAICRTHLRIAQLWYKEMLIFVWGNGMTLNPIP